MIDKIVRFHGKIDNIPQLKYDKERDLNNWVGGGLNFFLFCSFQNAPIIGFLYPTSFIK